VAESQKPPIIEALFERRWDARTGVLSEPIVTLVEVEDAIRAYNVQHPDKPLSTRNPANFFKDFIRHKQSANANWPQRVWQHHFTAKQVTGEARCFEFVLAEPGQIEPFPLNRVPAPTENTPRHRIESASMPLASRRLGRTDEAWLTQVVVRLRIVETHLALYSQRQVVQVDHLQMSVKGSPAEIDAIYLIHEGTDDNLQEAIVTLEAKGRRDDILEDQVRAQVRTAFALHEVEQDVVVPMAVKATGPSVIHVVEFEAVRRHDLEAVEELSMASDAVYELVPPVPGVGGTRSARPRRHAR